MTQEALKLALEALEFDSFYGTKKQEAITAIKEALAQPEQEPVQWGVDWGKAGDIPCVSIIKRVPNGGIEVMAVEYAPYSYTAPPQSTWVGLTDEEMTHTNHHMVEGAYQYSFKQGALWAEAKLKELNT